MNTSLRDQLKRWKKKNGMQHKDLLVQAELQKSPPKKKEQLSEDDFRYLMGTGRPTYRRYRGSYRQR